MPPAFDYEKSDERGVKVKRRDGNEEDVRATQKSEEIEIFIDDEVRGKVRPDGTLEWFADAKVHGDLQALGDRKEVQQVVVSTGMNLIELNTGLQGEQAPYSGIEVHRGDKPSAFLLYPEDTQRWTAVKEGERSVFAVWDDDLSNFNQDLTTDEIPEGSENTYFHGEAIKGGRGVEVDQFEKEAVIHQKSHTSSHNFWVSNEVERTRGSNREILPAFVSAAEHENKKASRVRAKLSAGSASFCLLVDGEPATDSINVDSSEGGCDKETDVGIEDGQTLGIEVIAANQARNLSVSITVKTTFNQDSMKGPYI